MWRKRFALLLPSLFLLPGLAACTFRVPKDPFTLVQNLSTDPDRLNPVVSNSGYSSFVDGFVFETLLDLDPLTLALKPKLAERWEITPDFLQYTFFLRKDVSWHDGKPFTAGDVVFTYEQIMNPRNDSGSIRNYFQDVAKVEKLDDYTVRFVMKKPYMDAINTFGMTEITPKHVFAGSPDINAHPANRAPVGTGPFAFAEWKTGRRIVLQRHEKYWGQPYEIRKIVCKIIPEDATAFELLKKEEIDVLGLMPLQFVKQTGSKKFAEKFVKHNWITRFSGYMYLGWNMDRPLFQDRRVRRALAHLVDLETINEKIFFGLYSVVTGPYHPLLENYDKSLLPRRYDPEEAKRLLSQAGWVDTDGDGILDKDGKPFRFKLVYSSGVLFYEQLTPILRENLARAGILLDLQRLEFVTLGRMMHEHDFDAYLAGWGRGSGEEDLYQIFHSSQIKGGSNYVSYANPEVDRLLELGRGEFDKGKRGDIYRQVHRILFEDQPYLFMYTGPNLTVRHARFKNVREYLTGFERREWKVTAQ